MYSDSHQPELSTRLVEHLSDIRQSVFLGMGTGNPHWLIETPSGRYVWRQFSYTNPGVERERELAVMQAIQGRCWAPELILTLPGEGLLMHEAPGQVMSILQQSKLTLTERQRALILQAVIECWQINSALPLCDYAGLIRQYAALAIQNGGKAEQPKPPQFKSQQVRQLREELLHGCADWPMAAARLTHHDLHPGNLLLSENHCTLIDWEFASLGNPWLDAVMLDQMLTLTTTERQQLEKALADYPLRLEAPWKTLRRWKNQFDQLWYLALPDQAAGLAVPPDNSMR